jgi:hypothetical protein
MIYKEVMQELEQLGNEQTKMTYIRHGAMEPIFGVKIGERICELTIISTRRFPWGRRALRKKHVFVNRRIKQMLRNRIWMKKALSFAYSLRKEGLFFGEIEVQ